MKEPRALTLGLSLCLASLDEASGNRLRLRVEVIVHDHEIEVAPITQVLNVGAKGSLAGRDLDPRHDGRLKHHTNEGKPIRLIEAAPSRSTSEKTSPKPQRAGPGHVMSITGTLERRMNRAGHQGRSQP
jgi:hypothetical protein